ncbi:hypothetical protein F4821DRAFT_55645 [Hypoxylon rubiginosum]|uniref:Uncharacterized protein n=1 Tax=Hypoxylon rubiginosum TaxID=110542 RepID=A0ACC0D9J6_9PEZI|nr:hypothetical protein F4821DRAFT_55645 [Hypoxylon rubiginosum]
MAGAKKKGRPVATATPLQDQSPTKTSALLTEQDLAFKIRALLYDFRNFRTDHTSQERLSLTTDPLYISSPHFTPEEAARIKAAIVDTYTEMSEDAETENDGYEDEEQTVPTTSQPQIVEDMLHAKFAKFLEKRKASGDSRPCGPHDMAPIYKAIFGISKTELEDENFLRRLRKSGLQLCREESKSTGDVGAKKKKRGGHY